MPLTRRGASNRRTLQVCCNKIVRISRADDILPYRIVLIYNIVRSPIVDIYTGTPSYWLSQLPLLISTSSRGECLYTVRQCRFRQERSPGFRNILRAVRYFRTSRGGDILCLYSKRTPLRGAEILRPHRPRRPLRQGYGHRLRGRH